MKILYSLPHPADRLASEQAGHIVRANALLEALEAAGHEIIRVEAASAADTQVAVSTYRRLFKKLLPRAVALPLRDSLRVMNSKRFARTLIDAIRQHKPDCILETHVAFTLAGKIASETTSVPLILDDVAPSWEEEQQYGVGLKALAHRTYRQTTGQARLLVAVNRHIHDLLIADGLPAEKLIVIENGIDERWLAQDNTGETWRSQYNIDPDTVVILFVGSFQPYHRVDLLVRAFARLGTSQACHLLLVGEGHTAPDCRVLTRELGISSRVTFAGQVPYSKIPTIIAAGDIAVMPATNQYGNPMKIYEYMAMGKPVIAPNQPTITEVISHDCGAYLFEPNSEDALREALQIFVDDPVRRLETGHQAYSLSTHHTWTKRAEQLATAIERL